MFLTPCIHPQPGLVSAYWPPASIVVTKAYTLPTYNKLEVLRRLLTFWSLQGRGRRRKSGGQQRPAPAKKWPDLLQDEYTSIHANQLLSFLLCKKVLRFICTHCMPIGAVEITGCMFSA